MDKPDGREGPSSSRTPQRVFSKAEIGFFVLWAVLIPLIWIVILISQAGVHAVQFGMLLVSGGFWLLCLETLIPRLINKLASHGRTLPVRALTGIGRVLAVTRFVALLLMFGGFICSVIYLVYDILRQ